jgi:transcriptional regulator with GAF, ATPase, and Fis domain
MDAELLPETFVELTDTMVAGFDVIDFLHVLTDRSVQLLDVSAAGLLLADPRGELRVVAASSEAARLLELFQLQNDQGPCLDCFRTGRPVAAVDLAAAASRWPRVVPAARQAGFGAVQALPMRLREQVIGALNLFRADPGALAPADIRVGQALADVVTISMLHERGMRHSDILNEQLQTALNSRVIIEQAKGKLAERLGWTWTRHSPCCATAPGPATAAYRTWPRPSSTAHKPSPRRTRAGPRPPRPCSRPRP